jgi:hypothetical protein
MVFDYVEQNNNRSIELSHRKSQGSIKPG